MTRRRVSGTVRRRGTVYWLRYTVNGKRIEESSGTGDERAARALLAQRHREMRDGTHRAGAPAPETFAVYGRGWLERRRAAGVRSVRLDEQALERFAFPAIGTLPLADVQRTHVRDIIDGVRTSIGKTTGEPLAPRTVLHVYRSIATCFADAVLDGRLAASPATLRTRRGELPRKRDAHPQWRAASVYSRDEAEHLISDERIPIDRRVYYGLGLLAGLRAGEIAGRRWRDYDRDALPLGRLVVATQADGALASRDTKTGDTRDVPVHPVLAALLAEWRLVGFSQLFLRHPTPDDPIIPSRGDPTGHSFTGKHMADRLTEDLRRIGLRAVPSPRHAMRATFLSLLEVDGANMAIARRATHAAPSDVVGGYIRVGWQHVCEEVAKLRVERLDGTVIAISTGTIRGTVPEKRAFSPMKLVGGTGIEPATRCV